MTNFFKYIGVFLLSVGSAFAVGGLLVSAKNSLRHSLFSTSFLVFSGLVFILMGLVFIAQQLLDSNIEKNKYSLGTMLTFIAVCLSGLFYVQDEQGAFFGFMLLMLTMFFAMFYKQIYTGWKRLGTLELKDRISVTISLAAFIISLLSLFK